MKENNGGEEQARSIFGTSMTSKPKWQQSLICSAGFFSSYLVNGISEEFSATLHSNKRGNIACVDRRKILSGEDNEYASYFTMMLLIPRVLAVRRPSRSAQVSAVRLEVFPAIHSPSWLRLTDPAPALLGKSWTDPSPRLKLEKTKM